MTTRQDRQRAGGGLGGTSVFSGTHLSVLLSSATSELKELERYGNERVWLCSGLRYGFHVAQAGLRLAMQLRLICPHPPPEMTGITHTHSRCGARTQVSEMLGKRYPLSTPPVTNDAITELVPAADMAL